MTQSHRYHAFILILSLGLVSVPLLGCDWLFNDYMCTRDLHCLPHQYCQVDEGLCFDRDDQPFVDLTASEPQVIDRGMRPDMDLGLDMMRDTGEMDVDDMATEVIRGEAEAKR